MLQPGFMTAMTRAIFVSSIYILLCCYLYINHGVHLSCTFMLSTFSQLLLPYPISRSFYFTWIDYFELYSVKNSTM